MLVTLPKRVEKLEEFYSEYPDFTQEQLDLNHFGLDQSKHIQQNLDHYKKEGNLLRIGIVGRVKAGKSSLLNALLFNGEDILPKAATPMTAALTIMTYSEEIKASVDFFSDADILEIKAQHDKYQQQVKYKFDEIMAELANSKKSSPQEMKERAQKRANRELKESPYLAGFEQYQKIQQANIDLAEIRQKYQEIQADSVDKLMNEQLIRFVGAKGEYMPFTKSVTLHLPIETLKGLEIIDTPGINDPVVSRGKRTEDLLSQCNVVLFVSPSAQLLTQQDMELVGTLTEAKGLSEIFIVASQIDNVLMGMEYRNQSLSHSLDAARSSLAAHVHQVLEGSIQSSPSMQNVFERFKKNQLLVTSGVSYSLAKKLVSNTPLDENQQFVFNNLTKNYPNDFSSEQQTAQSLALLSNIDVINQKIIKEVSEQKIKIFAEQQEHYLKGQEQALHKCLEQINQCLEDKIAELQTTSIDKIHQQKVELEQSKSRLNSTLNYVFRQKVNEIRSHIYSTLTKELQRNVRTFEQTEKKGTETEQYATTERIKVGERSTSTWYNPFSWGDTENIYETVTRYKTRNKNVIYAGAIRQSIEKMINNTNDHFHDLIQDTIENWKNDLKINLNQELKSVYHDDGVSNTINQALSLVLNCIPQPKFHLDPKLPSILDKVGTLPAETSSNAGTMQWYNPFRWSLPAESSNKATNNKSEGELFLEEAERYVCNLKNRVEEEINAYCNKLVSNLNGINISENFMDNINVLLSHLENDLINKESAIAGYQKMKEKSKAI